MEALRLQLDNLQKEKQEVEVKILKLSRKDPVGGTVIELEKERDQWKEDWERITVENIQLNALYEVVQHVSGNERNFLESENYCHFVRANRNSSN